VAERRAVRARGLEQLKRDEADEREKLDELSKAIGRAELARDVAQVDLNVAEHEQNEAAPATFEVGGSAGLRVQSAERAVDDARRRLDRAERGLAVLEKRRAPLFAKRQEREEALKQVRRRDERERAIAEREAAGELVDGVRQR
jgi:hypothetical protein